MSEDIAATPDALRTWPFTLAALSSVSRVYGYVVPHVARSDPGFSRVPLSSVARVVAMAADLVWNGHDRASKLVGLYLGIHAVAVAHGISVSKGGTSFYDGVTTMPADKVLSRLLDDILMVPKALRHHEASLGLNWALASALELARYHAVDVQAVAERAIRAEASAPKGVTPQA